MILGVLSWGMAQIEEQIDPTAARGPGGADVRILTLTLTLNPNPNPNPKP